MLEGWLLGQAGGSATRRRAARAWSTRPASSPRPCRCASADNPTVGDFPGEHGHVRYGEGLLIGYRWYDAHELDVAYPFGHGLSYTTFEYSDLEAEVTDDGAEVSASASVTVTNTGARAGRETVQVYVRDVEASVFRPEQELKAFTKVALEPGESTRVTLTLDARAFAFWHTPLGRWAVEGGAYEVRVGASSRDVRLTERLELTGEDLVPPLTADSEASAWLDHPVAGPHLRSVIGTGGADDISPMLLDESQHGVMIRAIPLLRLSRFPDFPIAEDELAGLAGQANTAARPV